MYHILLRDTNEEITVEKRKMSIRDGFVNANGALNKDNQQLTMIIPFTSIKYIWESITPDDNLQPKNEAENIKMWKFGDPPPTT